MPELPHDAALKIRSLCHELAVKYRLDDPTRDELCGHMEDKLAGYLSGDVRISEEDALLLVRAHFGDAEQVARRLGRQSFETPGSDLSQRLRRTLAASSAVLTLIAAAAFGFLNGGGYLEKGWLPLFVATVVAVTALVELTLFIAARVDARRSPDRLIAAWLMLAAVALEAAILVQTTMPGHTPTSWSGRDANIAAAVVAGATLGVSILTQMILVVLLLNPFGRSYESRMTVAVA